MVHEIFIVEDKEDLINELKPEFKSHQDILLKTMQSQVLESHLLDVPSLILINEDCLTENNVTDICKLIRNNEDNSATPIMVITSNTSPKHELDILKEEADYCIKKPVSCEALYYMVKNIIKLISTNRGISPLTKLPGNIPIQAELKKRLLKGQEFAVLYLDLDNFKAYNDTYGFLGGDEVIKQTARIILSNVNNCEDIHNFVRTYWWRRFCGFGCK